MEAVGIICRRADLVGEIAREINTAAIRARDSVLLLSVGCISSVVAPPPTMRASAFVCGVCARVRE